MKTIMRTSIYLPVAAILLTAALAGPMVAAPDKRVPFSGSMQGNEGGVLQGTPPSSLLVDGSGSGIATHLGRFTLTWSLTVTLADGTAIGSFRLIGANGDTIDTTIAGASEPTPTPGVYSITEINTITGGTGRFTNAKGSFTMERLTDLNTGFTSGSFHGTITSTGSAH